ncbi:MAG: helix-turn-helix transcriptional regulator [Lachnospiraceae bacterium]|nr:helix-turn-helix transcriptional regulator [Lachnospiraceae bacterium]
MTIGEKIKLLRKHHKLTQQEMAEMLGCVRNHFASIENSHINATPLFINCLCLTFHLDKEWLMDEENEDLTPLSKTYISEVSVDIYEEITEKIRRLDLMYLKVVDQMVNGLLELQEKK